MKKLILLTILLAFLLVPYTLAQQEIFLIDFTINNSDEINVERLVIIDGNPRAQDINSEYSAKMYAGDRILYFTDFLVDFGLEDSDEELEESYTTLRFPADKLANEVVVTKNDVAIGTISLGDYVCNNDNICSDYESQINCPQDCASGVNDRFCDGKADNICDPDCLIDQDADCKENETKEIISEEAEKPSILALILASLVLVSIIVFGYLEFRNIKNKESLGKNYPDKYMLRLKAYIEKELNKGFSEKRIRDVLTENGWKEGKVEEAFKGLK